MAHRARHRSIFAQGVGGRRRRPPSVEEEEEKVFLPFDDEGKSFPEPSPPPPPPPPSPPIRSTLSPSTAPNRLQATSHAIPRKAESRSTALGPPPEEEEEEEDFPPPTSSSDGSSADASAAPRYIPEVAAAVAWGLVAGGTRWASAVCKAGMIAPWARPTRTLATAVGNREHEEGGDEERDDDEEILQSGLGSGVSSVAAVQAANDALSTTEGPKRAAAQPPGTCEAA